MGRIGVITGLAGETDCFTSLPPEQRPPLVCAGARAERAAEGAAALIERGCTGLLSFGVAGGLDPELAPGTVIVADQVVSASGERFAVDALLRERLLAALGGEEAPVVAALAGSQRAVTGVRGKRALRRASGAAAVDMESLAVARVAAAADVPFAALRAIADDGGREVPPWVAAAIGPDGRARAGVVARGLLAHPWQGAAMLRLGRDFARAMRSLRRVAAALGPRFLLGG